MSRTEFIAILAGTITGVLVGAAMVATRYVINQTDPASLALLRYGIGTLGLIPPVLLIRRVRFERRDLLPIALPGIGQFGILIALLNYGLQFIGSGLGALLFATFPILTMILAAALRLEALTIAKTAGAMLTVAGVGLAVSDNAVLPDLSTGNLLGVIAVLASAFTGAVCSVFYRPYLEKYPPLQVSVFAMLASVMFLILPAAAEGFFLKLPKFTTLGWAAVLFIGFCSSLGYYTWLLALKHATPTRVALFLALGPVTATALGAALLGEPVTLLFLAGLAAVIAGLWLAHMPQADRASGP
ncbi:MAG: DMT family transporter [Alphaproteobacteria bacterium]|nr:DMT family transporter [Alphaproteobacteria bacterium]